VEYLTDLLYLYAKEKREDIKQILLDHKEATQFEDLLFSHKYTTFCEYYYIFLMNLEQYESRYSCIKDNFTGKIRDYFLFDVVKKSKYEEKTINVFFNDCQDERYKNYVKLVFEIREKLLSSTDLLLLQSDLSQISLEDILSKYTGKFVYLDIWASWCAPCRKLMPKSHQLAELFKEDVVFIYLSIDENVKLWKKAAQYESLDENNSYLISEKSSFIKSHENIGKKGIPYYMIFDRKGKLIDERAMRPNDISFIEKMEKIIKNGKIKQ
jgi:thiol-disulfide isomerase/thioredoxin